MVYVICNANCWTPTRCSTCGREVKPHGRSVAIEATGSFCDEDCPGYPDPNVRHLWSEHDETRQYVDPEGWRLHAASCDLCEEG